MSTDLIALRTRLDRIHAACFSLGPKQAVGEMVEAMLDMPEWSRLAAALSARPKEAAPSEELSDYALCLIAACRNAFPVPPPGSPIEEAWMLAISDPENVPNYMRAIAATKASTQGADVSIDRQSGDMTAEEHQVARAAIWDSAELVHPGRKDDR